MKIIITLVVLISFGKVFAADKIASCVVNSRDVEIDSFEVEEDSKDAVYFYDLNQNDSSKVKYRVTVFAAKELVVRIMNNDKPVSMGTWNATEVLAEGSTDFIPGSVIKVSTGLEANTAKRILTVSCSSKEKRPSFEGRNLYQFRL